jgi:hypothetical protein
MSNWKEQFDKKFTVKRVVGKEFGDTLLHWKSEAIQHFISKEIIEKLIDDIPEKGYFDDLQEIREVKQQLRDKWL